MVARLYGPPAALGELDAELEWQARRQSDLLIPADDVRMDAVRNLKVRGVPYPMRRAEIRCRLVAVPLRRVSRANGAGASAATAERAYTRSMLVFSWIASLLPASPVQQGPAAQPTTLAFVETLDSGFSGEPELWTPDGAAVVGGRFSLAIRHATEGSIGGLAWGPPAAPISLPIVDGLLFVDPASSVLPFVIDASGESPGLLAVETLEASLAGASLTAQPILLSFDTPDPAVALDALEITVGSTPPTLLPTREELFPFNPRRLEVGDLDADGHQDLIWGGVGVAGVRFGTEDPEQFVLADPIFFAGAVDALATGDFDGDGDLDVAALTTFSSEVVVFANDGVGTLTEAQRYSVAVTPTALTSGLLDDDEVVDLATVSAFPAVLEIAYGRADLQLGVDRTVATAASPQDVSAVDLDGDGDDDLAVACAGARTVSTYRVEGQTVEPLQSLPTPGFPSVLAPVRRAASQGWDLLVAMRGTGLARVLQNDGSGLLTSGQELDVVDRPRALATTDLDGDTWTEAFVLSDDPGAFSVLRPDEGSSGYLVESVTPPSANGILAVADIVGLTAGGDARLDLLVAFEDANSATVLITNGDDALGTSRIQDVSAAPGVDVDGGLVAFRLIDLGAGQGSTLVTLSETHLSLFGTGPSAADQSLLSSAAYTTESGAEGTLNGLASADLDGDGLLELVGYGAGDLCVFDISPELEVTQVFATSLSGNGFPGIEQVIATDVSGDGIPDLVLSALNVLFGAGDLSFGDGELANVYTSDHAVAVGDFDGDTVPDLAYLRYFSSSKTLRRTLYLGDGLGGFTEQGPTSDPLDTSSGSSTPSLFAVDLDEDGDEDLLAVAGGRILRYDNQGDAQFGPPSIDGDGGSNADWRLVDFDGDGRLDLLRATETAVFRYSQAEDGTFTEFSYSMALTGQVPLEVVDFDQDGQLDACVAATALGEIWFLRSLVGSTPTPGE